MRRHFDIIVLFTFCAVLLGCGGSSDNGSGKPAATVSESAEPVKGPGPAEVIKTFLAAVKQGDDGVAERLLTTKALEETKKHDLVIAPPGSATATFDVGEVEMVSGGAHVLSKWSDGPPEMRQTDEMVWVLRQDDHQWRIVGMITKPFDDMPPVVLDFEDPQDMLRQQELVQQEAMRRAQAENNAAAAPPANAANNTTPAPGGQPPASRETTPGGAAAETVRLPQGGEPAPK